MSVTRDGRNNGRCYLLLHYATPYPIYKLPNINETNKDIGE